MCIIEGCKERAVGKLDGKYELCAKHRDVSQVRCGRADCNKVLALGKQTVIAYKTFEQQPSHINVCEDCYKLETTRCDSCRRVIAVGGANFLQEVRHPSPSNLVLCGDCHKSVAYCIKCPRVVRAGDKDFSDPVSYPDDVNTVFRLCGTCRPEVTFKCRACGDPAGYTEGREKKRLKGATTILREKDQTDIVGWRCAVCSVGALGTTAEAKAAYDTAVRWMTGWVNSCGEKYPDYGNRLKWSIDRDATFQMDGDGMELGHCETTTYSDDKQLPTHRIQVLFYMRPLAFQETMLHELTHALVKDLKIAKKPLIEGFCNYVAYLYLTQVSNTGSSDERAEALRAMKRMEANKDPVYGDGFNTVREEMSKRHASEALTWFKGS